MNIKKIKIWLKEFFKPPSYISVKNVENSNISISVNGEEKFKTSRKSKINKP